MIKVQGFPDMDLVKTKFPDEQLLVKPKAIIECYQEIPCNPCATSCPFDAITIGEDINKIPVINYDLCTGCGSCVYSCPGLAIIIVKVRGDRVVFKIPYELLPVPVKGEIWKAVNRRGDIICDALIEGVMKNSRTDRTVVITVSVPKEYLYDFVTVRCPR
jgi:Fe-S-cluster-containing hydrogenase component 2